ncbi:MAG: SRPBCC family protein [Chlorobiales bacterium]|nr:SRPBCC family protein [Chlorobiales bacterium]
MPIPLVLTTVHWICKVMMIIGAFLFLNPANTYSTIILPETVIVPDPLVAEKARLIDGEVIIALSELPDDAVRIKGQIYIVAPPQKIWEVLIDYNNHKNFIPNVVDSGFISDMGNEKVVFEKGVIRMFIFQKKVSVQMKVWGEEFKHLYFKQIAGDFKIYQGEWVLVSYPKGQGTFLTYNADVKPNFLASALLVKSIQKRDCPLVLTAIKKQAEASIIITPKQTVPEKE